MGLFKKWFEGSVVRSTGQTALPTQSAQAATDIAQNYMSEPKNTNQMNKVATATAHPSLLQKTVLDTAALATKKSGLRHDQIKTSTPAVAGVFLNKLAPKAPNPFGSRVKPVV